MSIEKVCVSTKSQPRHHYAKIHDYNIICAHYGGFKFKFLLFSAPSSQAPNFSSRNGNGKSPMKFEQRAAKDTIIIFHCRSNGLESRVFRVRREGCCFHFAFYPLFWTCMSNFLSSKQLLGCISKIGFNRLQ